MSERVKWAEICIKLSGKDSHIHKRWDNLQIQTNVVMVILIFKHIIFNIEVYE